MKQPPISRRKFRLKTIPANQPSGQGPPATPAGRVPRVARLLALAHLLEQWIDRGEVADYAQLARRVHLSRARIAQVAQLRYLAPDLQDRILFLPPVLHGPDPITERDIRPIAAHPDWRTQRRMWSRLIRRKRAS